MCSFLACQQETMAFLMTHAPYTTLQALSGVNTVLALKGPLIIFPRPSRIFRAATYIPAATYISAAAHISAPANGMTKRHDHVCRSSSSGSKETRQYISGMPKFRTANVASNCRRAKTNMMQNVARHGKYGNARTPGRSTGYTNTGRSEQKAAKSTPTKGLVRENEKPATLYKTHGAKNRPSTRSSVRGRRDSCRAKTALQHLWMTSLDCHSRGHGLLPSTSRVFQKASLGRWLAIPQTKSMTI